MGVRQHPLAAGVEGALCSVDSRMNQWFSLENVGGGQDSGLRFHIQMWGFFPNSAERKPNPSSSRTSQ